MVFRMRVYYMKISAVMLFSIRRARATCGLLTILKESIRLYNAKI
jgi:hypothetical protein